jgi:hypothetical protein
MDSVGLVKLLIIAFKYILIIYYYNYIRKIKLYITFYSYSVEWMRRDRVTGPYGGRCAGLPQQKKLDCRR